MRARSVAARKRAVRNPRAAGGAISVNCGGGKTRSGSSTRRRGDSIRCCVDAQWATGNSTHGS
jgi:hypothetical protein